MSAMMTYVSSLVTKFSDLDLPDKISKSGPWTKTLLAAASVFGMYQSLDFVYTHYRKHLNDRKREVKRQENEQSIQALRKRVQQNPLNEAEVQRLTHLPLTNLIHELKTGKIRPIDALRAYQTQALRAHDRTNCLVEAIVEAEERALELEKGPRDGLLWGVPISIKDDVTIKGYENTIGMVVRIGIKSELDGAPLKVMLDHGAVPFVKTNVPQTEMSFEPGNPINGTVRNPHALDRSPAGSSSGEAALIASHGSPLGTAGDLAGSIRVPAHFCGIQGFKPTFDRNSARDMLFDDQFGMFPLRGVWGSLSREVDGLVLQMRALWENCDINKYDPSIPCLSFDHKEFTSNRKLRIGYYIEAPSVPTFSACKRAVMETVDLLTKEGHELVPWQPPMFEKTMQLLGKLFSVDGGLVLEALKYDRTTPALDEVLNSHPFPKILRRILDLLIRPLSPDTAENFMLRVGPADILTVMKMIYELEQFRNSVHDNWTEAKLDAIICPPNVMVAAPFGNSLTLFQTAFYTVYYNLLHYPAGVVHVTNVNESDVSNLDIDYPNPSDAFHKAAKAAMTSSEGLPVGVMVATPRFRDETCLRVMKIIEGAK